MFKAIKPRIRALVAQTGRAPSADEIDSMAKSETAMLRWTNSYTEIVICKKLGGYDKYWESNVQRLEPMVTEYANVYLNIIKQRDILSTSVNAIVTSQLNKLGIQYTITLLKTQLRLEYKVDKYRTRTARIHYKKFMNDPDISCYIELPRYVDGCRN